jgi:NAD(P)-dependent dehydrogenase (short-subunit alcohol dehydrogenase family)
MRGHTLPEVGCGRDRRLKRSAFAGPALSPLMRGLQADYQATRWGQSATDRRAHTKLRLGCRHSFGGRTIARHRLLGCCIITGRDKARLDEAIAGIGHGAIGIQGDASKLADLDRIYTTVGVEAGRIDVLFANAGFYEHGSFGEITAEHFDKTFNTNVRGVLFTVQKALPLLRPGASVILTGSIASIKGIPSMGVYDATKAAVRSFARSWIVDLKGRDIRVNVLSPGHILLPAFPSFSTSSSKTMSPVPCHLVGSAPPMTWARWLCSSLRPVAATSMALSCLPMAAWLKSDRVHRQPRRAHTSRGGTRILVWERRRPTPR